jgi:hypothetical protein
MATYPPPTETLPTFNSTVFTAPLLDALTIAEADARYLKFPISQGGETISGDLTVTGEVLTTSVIDTIDDVAGSLQIGTNFARTGEIRIGGSQSTGVGRTINIGTTASVGTLCPVNIAGSAITIGSANTSTISVNPNVTSALNLGNTMTGGTLSVGQSGATSSSTVISIGNGSNQTGNINIGTGGTTFKQITIGNITGAGGTLILGSQTISVANTSNTTALNLGTGMTGGAVILGGTTGGTSTLTVNRPIAPAYLPSAIGTTNIGYQTSSTNNTFTTAVAGVFEVMNTGSITAGVWMVEGCFVFSGATGGGRRMGLNTASAVLLDSRTQGVATGSFAQLAVSSIFSFSTATTVYLNIDITAGLGGAGSNISTLRWTRLA